MLLSVNGNPVAPAGPGVAATPGSAGDMSLSGGFASILAFGLGSTETAEELGSGKAADKGRQGIAGPDLPPGTELPEFASLVLPLPASGLERREQPTVIGDEGANLRTTPGLAPKNAVAEFAASRHEPIATGNVGAPSAIDGSIRLVPETTRPQIAAAMLQESEPPAPERNGALEAEPGNTSSKAAKSTSTAPIADAPDPIATLRIAHAGPEIVGTRTSTLSGTATPTSRDDVLADRTTDPAKSETGVAGPRRTTAAPPSVQRAVAEAADAQFDTVAPIRDVASSDPVGSPRVADTTAHALPLARDLSVATPALAKAELSAPVQVQQPADFSALVDRLVEAREAAGAQAVSATMRHDEFGRVSISFRHAEGSLNVGLASSDPGFAPAVQAAAASQQARQEAEQAAGQQSRNDHHGQHAAQQNGGGSSHAGAQSPSRDDTRSREGEAGRQWQQAEPDNQTKPTANSAGRGSGIYA